MRLRRRPPPERVREVQASVVGSYGEEIMRLRKAIHAAVSELYAGRPDAAQRMLSAALAERWWR